LKVEFINDRESTTDSQLSFLATEGINYIVRVSSWSEEEVGTYQLNLTTTEPPDLSISETNLPSSITPGEEVEVTWTVNNTGNSIASANWDDYIYISNDATFDENDTFVSSEYIDTQTPLIAGNNYTITKNITLPPTALGSRYLLFVSDRFNAQVESNENNNVTAVPLEITAPDLVVSNATAPSNATLGETIPISWTVENQGEVTADADWNDRVYLSRDTTFDNSDTYLSGRYINAQTPLTAGGNYSITQNVIIPSTTPGNHYLLFVADGDNFQGESNETNNIKALEINLNAPPIVGTISAANTSISGTLSSSDAKNPTRWATYSDDYTITELTPGKPVILDLEAPFDAYLQLINADTQSAIAQDDYTGAGNNPRLTFTPTTGINYIARVTSYFNNDTGNYTLSTTSDLPDLTISPQSIFNSATPGETLAVSWKVNNPRSGSAQTNWYDAVYLSNDATFDNSDTYLTNQYVDAQTPLAANGEYTITKNITIPSTATLGERYLLFISDYYDNAQVESNEGNNVAAAPLQINNPDLVISSSSASTNRAASGETIAVNWTVNNSGNVTAPNNWYDRVYLSSDTTIDGNDTQLIDEYIDAQTPLNAGGNYSNQE
jgi:large repetitive protein